MLRTPVKARRGAQTASTVSVSAPVGGLNAIDPIANMKPTDALRLTNWWCTPYDVQVRQGFKQYTTGLSGQVETLAPYNKTDGTGKIFAAAGTSIYDVTSGGAVGAAVQTGLSNARWQYVNMVTPGGQYLYLFNGVDKPRLYDGTSWVAVDGASTPAITGVTTTTLIGGCVHKNRLWLIEKDKLKAWYLPTQSIGGAATAFDISSFASRGGYLMAIIDLTMDAGIGIDDHLCFITSKGEVLIYKGTDPASSSTWTIVGAWKIGEPLGRRCVLPFAGDVVYISKDGIAGLTNSLQSTQVNRTAQLTNRIQHWVSEDTSTWQSQYGWQALAVPNYNMLIVNVPESTTKSHQWAMNTISNAWTRFEDVNATCWCLYNDEPYFGGTNTVYKFWTGYSDNQNTSGLSGSNINYSALQAFSYFGNRSHLKHFRLVRPTLQATGQPSLYMAVNTDYDTSLPTTTPSYGSSGSGDVWGTPLWGAFKWSGGGYLLAEWQHASGVGYSAALALRGASMDIDVHWTSCDYVYEQGGIV